MQWVKKGVKKKEENHGILFASFLEKRGKIMAFFIYRLL